MSSPAPTAFDRRARPPLCPLPDPIEAAMVDAHLASYRMSAWPLRSAIIQALTDHYYRGPAHG